MKAKILNIHRISAHFENKEDLIGKTIFYSEKNIEAGPRGEDSEGFIGLRFTYNHPKTGRFVTAFIFGVKIKKL